MKILSFGHIPTWAGGRQNSGIANVIYQLAKYGSEVDDANVVLAATDVFVPERKDGNLLIAGWTKKMLLKFALLHPVHAIRNLIGLIRLVIYFPLCEHFWGVYFKRLFLVRSLLEYRPDLVHLHGMMPVYYLELIPQNIRRVVTFHGICGTDSSLPNYKRLYKMEKEVYHSPNVDALFFISNRLVGLFSDAYGEIDPKKKYVIFNSYDEKNFYYYDNFRREKSDKTVLCTIASLSELKGQGRVIKAIGKLSTEKFRYFCIGYGEEQMVLYLSNLAKENNVGFEYLGTMKPDRIREHLYQADYMIMPSSSEGFGLSYLESIACGVPVIMPRDIPIASEKSLINDSNSILLDDCSEESIVRVLSEIDNYRFNRAEVANSIKGSSWWNAVKQYYTCFKIIIGIL